MPSRRSGIDWESLLKRVFAIDALICPVRWPHSDRERD
jgi:hypothetical protein